MEEFIEEKMGTKKQEIPGNEVCHPASGRISQPTDLPLPVGAPGEGTERRGQAVFGPGRFEPEAK